MDMTGEDGDLGCLPQQSQPCSLQEAPAPLASSHQKSPVSTITPKDPGIPLLSPAKTPKPR